MSGNLRTSLVIYALMTALLGGLYPATVWIAGRIFFHTKAEGSLIYKNGRVVGSELLGQQFQEDRYFWARPSIVEEEDVMPTPSGSVNRSLTHPENIPALKRHATRIQNGTAPIPIEMVTHSASGLDPHISRSSALYQIPRVAKARKIPLEQLVALIDRMETPATLGLVREKYVNILQLNMALDSIPGSAP